MADPRDKGGIGAPVQWLNQRTPWISPSGTPDGPGNLPKSRDLPSTFLQQNAGMTVPGYQGNGQTISDPYRYAAFATASTTVGTTSFLLLSAPVGKRNFLGFRNASSTQTIYIDFGSAATTSSWLQLSPGALVMFDTVVSQDDIWVISDAAAGTLAYAWSNFPG